jgi:hypothetical protein
MGLFETRLANARSGMTLSADTVAFRAGAMTARGAVKVAETAYADPDLPVEIEASSMTSPVSGKGIAFLKGLRFRTGRVFLTADRAVMPQAPSGTVALLGWTLTGNVAMHLPQGDLHADSATLYFRPKRRLLALITTKGSWIEAADQSSENTKTRSGAALQIQYDIHANAVEIESTADAE